MTAREYIISKHPELKDESRERLMNVNELEDLIDGYVYVAFKEVYFDKFLTPTFSPFSVFCRISGIASDVLKRKELRDKK